MVSAGAANKKAFGIDRTTNPWSDMVGTEVIWVAGSNVAECSPITTNYIWQAREQGAKVIVAGPAHHADRAHVRPVPAGQARPRRGAVRRRAAADDRARLARSRLHRAAHRRLRRRSPSTAGSGRRARTAEVTGVPERSIRAGRRVVGHGEDQLPLPRARHRAPLATACRTRSARSTSCSPPAASASRRAATARSSARPTARAAASTGRSAISSPAGATSPTPSTASTSPASGASTSRTCPGPGVDAYEMFRKIDAGEIKGLLVDLLQPEGLAARQRRSSPAALEKLEFYVAIDFFLNDTARHADIVLPGSLQEEDEGTVTQVEGRVIKINKAVDCPGEARQDWRIIQDIAQRARPAARLHVRRARARSSRSCASPARAASPTTPASPTRRSSSRWASSGRATATIRRPASRSDHPGHAAAVRARAATTRSRRARAVLLSRTARRASTSPTTARRSTTSSEEYPLFLTTGRVVSQFLSGTQTRRIGPLVDQYPEPRIEMHPRLAAKLGIADGDWTTAETRRGAITLRRRSSRRSGRTRSSSRITGPGAKSANQLTVAAQDPISKIPQYKVCGCRVRKADGAAGLRGGARAAAVASRDAKPEHLAVLHRSRTAASAARRACRRAPSATRIAASR